MLCVMSLQQSIEDLIYDILMKMTTNTNFFLLIRTSDIWSEISLLKGFPLKDIGHEMNLKHEMLYFLLVWPQIIGSFVIFQQYFCHHKSRIAVLIKRWAHFWFHAHRYKTPKCTLKVCNGAFFMTIENWNITRNII